MRQEQPDFRKADGASLGSKNPDWEAGMTLKEILKGKGSKVWWVRGAQTIQEAVSVLVREGIGALLVLGPQNNIVGIISERDIIRGCSDDIKNVGARKVSELMTKDLIVASPEDDVNDLMQLMTEHRVRHIPVVQNGQLQGIVSIGDVVKSMIHESEHQIRYLKEFIYGPGI